MSVVSYEIHLILGFDYFIVEEKILLELFIFVAFNAFCFALVGKKNKKLILQNTVNVKFKINFLFFKSYAFIFFITALVNILFVAGLNVAQNRVENLQEQQEFISSGGGYSIIALIGNIIEMLNIPFTILSGIVVGNHYFYLNKQAKWIYFLTPTALVLNTVAAGGRSGVVLALTYFFLGIILSLFSKKANYFLRIKSISKYALFLGIFFILYSTYVNIQRSIFGTEKQNYQDRWAPYPILAPLSGVLQYTTDHYWGYQLRRLDTFTEKLEWGQTTFASFTLFKVPVVSQLTGSDISLQSIFDLKDPNPIKNKLKDNEKQGIGLTATVYFILYDDFGYWGTFIAIILFTIYSERQYVKLFKIRIIRNFWQILPFIVVYKLWTVTYFSHHLSSTWLNSFIYPVLIIDFVNYLTTTKKYNTQHRKLAM